jgi:hypothetical protein
MYRSMREVVLVYTPNLCFSMWFQLPLSVFLDDHTSISGING